MDSSATIQQVPRANAAACLVSELFDPQTLTAGIPNIQGKMLSFQRGGPPTHVLPCLTKRFLLQAQGGQKLDSAYAQSQSYLQVSPS